MKYVVNDDDIDEWIELLEGVLKDPTLTEMNLKYITEMLKMYKE